MTTLVYFIHADPSVRAKYEAALGPLGDFDLVFVNAGAYSGAYQTLGEKLRKNGRVLPQLRLMFPPPRDGYGSLVVVTFSAGYALARALLRSTADRDAIDALVMLDSLHAGFDPDHTAADAQVEPFADFARLARDGRKVFYLGHTDVHTPQTGSGAFASTTQAAAELVRLAGEPVGNFVVRAYDTERTDEMQEHRNALNVWGPPFVAEAVNVLRDVRQTLDTVSDTDPAPAAAGDLEAALLRHAQATVGIHETGANRGPWIDDAIRAVGLEPPQYWCAAAWTRWLREACAELGVPMPVPGGAGALAIGVQLVRAGLAVTAEQLRRGEGLDVLVPGATCVWRRPAGGPNAGHINVLERWDGDDRLPTVGGNQNDSVCRTLDRLSDPLLVCVSRVSRGAIGPSPEALEIAGRQLALSLALEHGAGGLDDLPAVEPMA